MRSENTRVKVLTYQKYTNNQQMHFNIL